MYVRNEPVLHYAAEIFEETKITQIPNVNIMNNKQINKIWW